MATTPRPAPTLKPLRGVRVLSLALNLPGPAAFMRLKAMGANCVKAEPPGPKGAPAGTSGDPMGQYNAQAYATLHDGIKVVTIDLKSERGQATLHKELARTDVLLTSFRPSALEKLQLGWRVLHKRHPGLSVVPTKLIQFVTGQLELAAANRFVCPTIHAVSTPPPEHPNTYMRLVSTYPRLMTVSTPAIRSSKSLPGYAFLIAFPKALP